jgi:Zn-dependent peptidase ImmA (M78 family)
MKVTTLEEIVHFMLNHRPSTISTTPHRERFRDYHVDHEKEAYAVAAAILLPKRDLEEAIRRHLMIDEIAANCGISSELVEFRINSLLLRERFYLAQELRRIFSSSGTRNTGAQQV